MAAVTDARSFLSHLKFISWNFNGNVVFAGVPGLVQMLARCLASMSLAGGFRLVKLVIMVPPLVPPVLTSNPSKLKLCLTSIHRNLFFSQAFRRF